MDRKRFVGFGLLLFSILVILLTASVIHIARADSFIEDSEEVEFVVYEEIRKEDLTKEEYTFIQKETFIYLLYKE